MSARQPLPMLRVWTWRYALILFAALLLIGLLAGIWIYANAYRHSYDVLQARAEQLADSYVRISSLTSVQADTQPAANSLKTDLSVRPIVPLASAEVSSPVQAISATVVARPANGETMQIVDAQGKVLDMYAEDSGNADSGTAAAPSDYKTVLSGQPTRERLVKQDVTWLRIGVPLQQQSGVAGALYLSAPIQEDINNTKQLYVLIALMAFGIAAAGWAAIYLLLRKLTQPLRQLAHAALQVADGQYSRRCPPSTDQGAGAEAAYLLLR